MSKFELRCYSEDWSFCCCCCCFWLGRVILVKAHFGLINLLCTHCKQNTSCPFLRKVKIQKYKLIEPVRWLAEGRVEVGTVLIFSGLILAMEQRDPDHSVLAEVGAYLTPWTLASLSIRWADALVTPIGSDFLFLFQKFHVFKWHCPLVL